MTLRDTPTQCEIGDGVLASSVRHIGNFDTHSNVVEFRPKVGSSDIRDFGSVDAFEKALVGETWIFARCDWKVVPGKTEPAWIREQ